MAKSKKWDAEKGVWEGDAAAAEAEEVPRPLWVFGYASVCWRTDFPFEERRKGKLSGYVRRFWQQSTDHRGTPQNPGYVCTLVPSSMDSSQEDSVEEPAVCGVCFRIADSEVESVVKHLDYRERGGYSRIIERVRFLDEDRSVDCVVYVAEPSNPHFKPRPMEEVARVIADSEGPSGRNSEYLISLNEYLIRERMKDDYIDRLTQSVKGMIQSRSVEGHVQSKL